MASRALTVGLVLAAVAADAHALHRLGFYLLVAAVPGAAIAALAAFGELVELPGHAPGQALARLQALLGGLALALVVVAAAARGHATDGGTVPALAASASLGCLVVFAMQGLAALERQRVGSVLRQLDQRLNGEERAHGDDEASGDGALQRVLARR